MNIIQLRAIMPRSSILVDRFFVPLRDAMAEFQIDRDPRREVAFLAQGAHESGELAFVRELDDGFIYEGRADLGNIHPGDGPRYKGRGLLQVTGRNAYKLCGDALGYDLVAHPELLEETVLACRSAGWVWSEFKKLNQLAEQEKFGTITRRINGGYNGLDSRLAYWRRALKAYDL